MLSLPQPAAAVITALARAIDLNVTDTSKQPFCVLSLGRLIAQYFEQIYRKRCRYISKLVWTSFAMNQ
jgi:hypothetical protein